MSPVEFKQPPEAFTLMGKLVYLAACLTAGIRTARYSQIARTVPVETAVSVSLTLAKLVIDKAQRQHIELFQETAR